MGPLPGSWLGAHTADLTPGLQVCLSWGSIAESFHSLQSLSVSCFYVILGLPGPRFPSSCISQAVLTAPLERSTCPYQVSLLSFRWKSRSSMPSHKLLIGPDGRNVLRLDIAGLSAQKYRKSYNINFIFAYIESSVLAMAFHSKCFVFTATPLSPPPPPPPTPTHTLLWVGILFSCYPLVCPASLSGSVGCAIRLETRRSWVQPPPRSATFFRGDWLWNIFYGHSLPSADSRRAVVSFWQKNVHNT